MRKLKHVLLQGSIHVPGIGTLDQTLPSQSKTIAGLEMYDAGDKVLVRTSVAGVKEFFISLAYIKVATYADPSLVDAAKAS